MRRAEQWGHNGQQDGVALPSCNVPSRGVDQCYLNGGEESVSESRTGAEKGTYKMPRECVLGNLTLSKSHRCVFVPVICPCLCSVQFLFLPFQPYIEEICESLRGDIFQKFMERYETLCM